MTVKCESISRIEVNGLWGKYDLVWNLNRDVNILSGLNGSGKSTIIRALVQLFRQGTLSPESHRVIRGIVITFEGGQQLSSAAPEDLSDYRIDVVSTFDSRLIEFEAVRRLSEGTVATELDWEIYRIQKRFLTYQLAQGKRAIELLRNHASPEEVEAVTQHKTLFYNIIDGLFRETGKTIDRESDELRFDSEWGKIIPYMLSAGEKQILLILATVLTQDNQPAILLMDEPDISLHFDWQSTLIGNILELNPAVQLIMSTHSPAVIMEGWVGHVTELRDLIVRKP